MPIPVRVSALLALILAFSLMLTAALGYAKFQKALAGVTLARQQVTVRGLADSIETGLNLGLLLSEVQNLRPLVEQAARSHPDLLLAEVVDSAGRQVFQYQSSDTAIHRSWANQLVPATGWTHFGPRTIGLAEPLNNSFGQRVGVVVLEFARTGFDSTLADISKFTIDLLLTVAGGGALLCGALGLILHRPLDRTLKRMEDEMNASASGDQAISPRSITASVAQDIRAIREKLHYE
jgi:hypothetical protein